MGRERGSVGVVLPVAPATRTTGGADATCYRHRHPPDLRGGRDLGEWGSAQRQPGGHCPDVAVGLRPELAGIGRGGDRGAGELHGSVTRAVALRKAGVGGSNPLTPTISHQELSCLQLPSRWPNNCPNGQKPLSSRRDACRCARGGGVGKVAARGAGRAVVLEIQALTRIRPVRAGNPRNVSTWAESRAATRRFGIDPPEAVGKLRDSAALAVLNVCGVPVSLATAQARENRTGDSSWLPSSRWWA